MEVDTMADAKNALRQPLGAFLYTRLTQLFGFKSVAEKKLIGLFRWKKKNLLNFYVFYCTRVLDVLGKKNHVKKVELTVFRLYVFHITVFFSSQQQGLRFDNLMILSIQ